jgi:hypothetical protein
MGANCFPAAAPVTRRVRAYFAPVNRVTGTPVVFDPTTLGKPAGQGSFSLNAPPAPWINLGWIQGFTRKAASQTRVVMTGIPAASLAQVRESLDAEVSFQFLSWTKLTMALATGSQHMNVLAPAAGAAAQGVGATAATAVVVQAGSTASALMLASADAAQFSAGSLVAVDCDYIGQTGFVGSPVAGAYLRQALSDVDYVRRVTFNVALVAQVSATGLTLAAPLPGGVPPAGAKAQAVMGFVDREGGCFWQEWSALFVMEGSQGDRIAFHYPRLQATASAEEVAVPLAGKGKGSLERVLLKAQFRALPVTDAVDGERVLCYRSFVPAAKALV